MAILVTSWLTFASSVVLSFAGSVTGLVAVAFASSQPFAHFSDQFGS
ncbi:hypothetical protein II941_04670 [bacterium]|nr:hypothetical protein [bacterium]